MKKYILLAISSIASLLPCAAGKGVVKDLVPGQWSKEKAAAWYKETGTIRGCNYLPRTAVNVTEMWQADTFDPKTIDQELGWASKAGYNSVRVFLQYLVWKDDAEGLKKRIDQFLAIADKHGISTMMILFCDCSFAGKQPYVGKQDEPVPGVHNSAWVPSPGHNRVKDTSVWYKLERYVKDIVGAFSKDKRILIWDLYNEPGNGGMGEASMPLADTVFAWAREVNPSQPLTTGPWTAFDKRMSRRHMKLSDIVSFHGYGDAADTEKKIKKCLVYGRPVICTEWLHRPRSNTFENILPLFSKYKVGGYHWGLVAGRTQTYMPWGSKRGDPMPELWQHDTFHADGKLYNAQEIELLRSFDFGK